MSTKIDQSLDEILRSNPRAPRRGRRVASGRANVAPVAPVGGIKKNTRNARPATKASITAGAAVPGDSKIIVSGLPSDVNEGQVKEYFHSTVGPVKKVQVTYGPNGTSRGIATVTFNRGDAAHKALKQLNGVLVDGKPIKIEVVLDAARAPSPAPVKTLSERVAKPKTQPKSAAPKPVTNGVTAATRGGRPRAGRGNRRGGLRRKPKTTEELDAEMNDYFDVGGNNATAVNGDVSAAKAPAATGGDAAMEDEIM